MVPSNQDKLEKVQRFENKEEAKHKDVGSEQINPWVYDFVKANVNILPDACRSINDKGEMPKDCSALERK